MQGKDGSGNLTRIPENLIHSACAPVPDAFKITLRRTKANFSGSWDTAAYLCALRLPARNSNNWDCVWRSELWGDAYSSGECLSSGTDASRGALEGRTEGLAWVPLYGELSLPFRVVRYSR